MEWENANFPKTQRNPESYSNIYHILWLIHVIADNWAEFPCIYNTRKHFEMGLGHKIYSWKLRELNLLAMYIMYISHHHISKIILTSYISARQTQATLTKLCSGKKFINFVRPRFAFIQPLFIVMKLPSQVVIHNPP